MFFYLNFNQHLTELVGKHRSVRTCIFIYLKKNYFIISKMWVFMNHYNQTFWHLLKHLSNVWNVIPVILICSSVLLVVFCDCFISYCYVFLSMFEFAKYSKTCLQWLLEGLAKKGLCWKVIFVDRVNILSTSYFPWFAFNLLFPHV